MKPDISGIWFISSTFFWSLITFKYSLMNYNKKTMTNFSYCSRLSLVSLNFVFFYESGADVGDFPVISKCCWVLLHVNYNIYCSWRFAWVWKVRKYTWMKTWRMFCTTFCWYFFLLCISPYQCKHCTVMHVSIKLYEKRPYFKMFRTSVSDFEQKTRFNNSSD